MCAEVGLGSRGLLKSGASELGSFSWSGVWGLGSGEEGLGPGPKVAWTRSFGEGLGPKVAWIRICVEGLAAKVSWIRGFGEKESEEKKQVNIEQASEGKAREARKTGTRGKERTQREQKRRK